MPARAAGWDADWDDVALWDVDFVAALGDAKVKGLVTAARERVLQNERWVGAKGGVRGQQGSLLRKCEERTHHATLCNPMIAPVAL